MHSMAMGTALNLVEISDICSHAGSCLPLDLQLARQHGHPEAYLCWDVLLLFLPHPTRDAPLKGCPKFGSISGQGIFAHQ